MPNRPSTNALPNRVDWYQLNPVEDVDGSLNGPPSYPSVPTQAAVPCSVQLSNAERLADGSMVITTLYRGWVEFATDLGLKLNDRLDWYGTAWLHQLFVIGVTDGAGRGSVFGAQVEERV